MQKTSQNKEILKKLRIIAGELRIANEIAIERIDKTYVGIDQHGWRYYQESDIIRRIKDIRTEASREENGQ